MARSKVPQFGKWENQGDIPYTVCFDQARMNRAGKMINPNDPSENPDMFRNMDPSPFAPPPKPRTRQEPPIGRGENGHFRQASNSSGRGESTGPRPGYESNHGGGRGQRPARPSRPSAGGSDLSFENSPHHPSKASGRKVDSSHDTHGRSRLRQGRVDETPERGAAAVPIFKWNENDPDSEQNFTDIFEKVREDRNAGPRTPSANPNRTPLHGSRGQHYDASKKNQNQPFWHRFVFFWRK